MVNRSCIFLGIELIDKNLIEQVHKRENFYPAKQMNLQLFTKNLPDALSLSARQFVDTMLLSVGGQRMQRIEDNTIFLDLSPPEDIEYFKSRHKCDRMNYIFSCKPDEET